MRRRELLLSATAMMASARNLRAQQKAMPVIGWLGGFSPPANPGDLLRGPIHLGLNETGFVEGQNMMSEYRWADFHNDRLPALAADLVNRKVDVILTTGGAHSALAAKTATSTIPIVFADVGDPVGFGLVASLARPGSNVTGFSALTIELIPKRFELLCEMVPQAAVIALLVNPDSEVVDHHIRTTQEAARAKGVRLDVLKASTADEIDAAFVALDQLQAGGLLIHADVFFVAGACNSCRWQSGTPFQRSIPTHDSSQTAA